MDSRSAITITAASFGPTTLLEGALHMDVAFDWGEEIELERARRLAEATADELPRRPRTPSSIAYKPPPLVFALPPVTLQLPPLGTFAAACHATVFDFGGMSVHAVVSLKGTAESFRKLAGQLAQAEVLVESARRAARPLFDKLLPAIKEPHWSSLSEEYFVFRFAPGDPLPPPSALLAAHGDWLASLCRLEAAPLSSSEVEEALRLNLTYSPADLFVADWSAAVLIDSDCAETLRTIEFANLQLLEFRHIDARLDERLADAYRLVHPPVRAWLPFWRTQARQLRLLGEMRVEANSLFERAGNVLKLVGDQYLARVYRMLGSRFHLTDWEASIQRSLDVALGVYQAISDQAAIYRTELLELVIIFLIFFEIVMAFVRD